MARSKQYTIAPVKYSSIHAIAKVVIGNGSYMALGFLANIVAANGLEPTGFGMLALALALLNVLQEICGSGIDLAMVRLAAPHTKSDPARAEAIFRAAFRIKLIANSGIALLIFVIADWIAQRIYLDATMTPLLRWVSVGLVGAALYNYIIAKFQTQERFDLYAVLRVVGNLSKLILLGILSLLNAFTPQSVAAAWMGSFFLSFGIALAFNQRQSELPSKAPDLPYWIEIVRFGQWVIMSSFLFALYSRTDLLLLGHFTEVNSVGQYAVAWNLNFVIDLLTYSVIIALLPSAARMATHLEYQRYFRSTLTICALLAFLLLPLYFLSDWFFELLFPDYLQAAEIFRILFIGAIVTLVVHPVYLVLYARNRVSLLTWINLFLAIFTLLVGVVIIPRFGAMGAAWVTVAGRVFASIMILLFVLREIRN
ncbi:MAG: oligosaccharide flippase family protein [Gammaproteobacteria bacterium]|nr:oligosaccharide flippase family protein [Gammaproteobacteria bacterium]